MDQTPAPAHRVNNHAGLIWSIADLLRGDYKQSEYGRVILPLVVLRRLDCVLEPTKPQVLSRLAALAGKIENVGPILESITGLPDEVVETQRAAFVAAGQAELRRQRQAGVDRGHGGEAGRSRGSKLSASRQATAEWDRSNGPRPNADVFRREVLPLIEGISPAKLAEATGLSRPYCGAILRRHRVPHPRWWGALSTCASTSHPAER